MPPDVPEATMSEALVRIAGALRRSGVRTGREDDEADRAALYAVRELAGLDSDLLPSFWLAARELGLRDDRSLTLLHEAASRLLSPRGVVERAIAALPEDAGLVVRYNAALLLHGDLGAVRQAAEILEALASSWPEDADVWLLWGNVRRDLGDVAGAIEAFETSGELTDDYGPWLNLGQLLKAEGRYAEARAAMERCCARDDEAEHLHVWGHLILLCGEEAEGDEALARAEAGYSRRIRAKQAERRWNRRVDAELAPSFFWRGAARCLRGNLAGARRDLAKALAGDPALSTMAREEEDYAALRATAAGRALTGG